MLIRDWMGDGVEDNELARISSTIDAMIAADAAVGSSGDYAAQLMKNPKFSEFESRLSELHARMQKPPDPEREVKPVLIEAWEEACSIKRMMLDLGPKEV